MQNEFSTHLPELKDAPEEPLPEARPEITATITRGVYRFMRELGYAAIPEWKLPNGRRADLAGLNQKGRLMIVEVKSCREDFVIDKKWPDYREYCDLFYFATPPEFPQEILPEDVGLIVADAWGGAILRESQETGLVTARRKALTLKFARQAAQKLHQLL